MAGTGLGGQYEPILISAAATILAAATSASRSERRAL